MNTTKNYRLAAKCTRIHLAGIKALSSGEVRPFTGFPPGFATRFNVSVLFSNASQAEFRKRIVSPMLAIAQHLEMSLYLASRDYAFHSTVGECELSDLADAGQFGRLRDEVGIEELLDEEIVFSELVLDKGNVLLNSVDMPLLHDGVREILKQRSTFFGQPIALDDILHATIARLTTFRSDSDILDMYIHHMMCLGMDLRREPLRMKVSGIYCGPTLNLIAP